jgi:multiple sugar transport system substrate-binding protein
LACAEIYQLYSKSGERYRDFDKMMSMIPTGRSRPSISEYPQIADNIREAIEDVYYGIKEPKQALDYAAAKSAKVLGWK